MVHFSYTISRRSAHPTRTPRAADDRGVTLLRLESGAAGDVYLARDLILGDVAVRFLSYAGPEHTKDVQQAVQKVIGLHHPNVAAVYGLVDDRLVMEYVPGTDLAELLQQAGAVPEAIALDIAIGIARALHVAHRQGLIHGNLKPQNVLVGQNGQIKVADFWIAAQEHAAATGEGGPASSVHYASPEQIQRQEVDARTDIYSLGVLLFELLAGSTPFGGRSSRDVARAHVEELPPAIREIRREVSPPTAAILVKALAKNPADRYSSAAAMLRDLEGVRMKLAEEQGRAERKLRAANLVPEVNPRRVTRLLMAAAAALALSLLAGLLVFMHVSQHPTSAQSTAADSRAAAGTVRVAHLIPTELPRKLPAVPAPAATRRLPTRKAGVPPQQPFPLEWRFPPGPSAGQPELTLFNPNAVEAQARVVIRGRMHRFTLPPHSGIQVSLSALGSAHPAQAWILEASASLIEKLDAVDGKGAVHPINGVLVRGRRPVIPTPNPARIWTFPPLERSQADLDLFNPFSAAQSVAVSTADGSYTETVQVPAHQTADIRLRPLHPGNTGIFGLRITAPRGIVPVRSVTERPGVLRFVYGQPRSGGR